MYTKKEIKRIFDKFDRDGNGSIDMGELKKILKVFKRNVTDEEVKFMMEDLDSDGNGEIDFEEFCDMIQSTLIKEAENEKYLKEAFMA